MPAPLNLPLARAALDRDGESRNDISLFEKLLTSPNAVAVVLYGDKALADSQSAQLRLLRISELAAMGELNVLAYLGKTLVDEGGVVAGTQVLLVDADDALVAKLSGKHVASENDWLVLRRSGLGLSDRDSGLLTQALAIANWNRGNNFCANCSARTDVAQAGWARKCSVCEKEAFPRTDPAIIASLIDDEDRILLGSQGTWADNRWSILAGYVDAGETLVAAVEREMFEEAGLRVSDVTYLGSQPWPYPFSLMVGFTARVRGEQQLRPDGVEIEKLRWFSREELRAEAHGIYLPSKVSISRALIEAWMGEPIESATELGSAK